MKTRKEKQYNKVVNYNEETKEVTVLDYIFYDTLHNKPFNGAVGSVFEVVSKEEVEEIIEPSNVLNFLSANQIGLNCKFSEIDEDGFIDMMFDTSYKELWDYIRKELNLDEEEAYIFNCTGGGRCFDKNFQGNINPELSKKIRNAEK